MTPSRDAVIAEIDGAVQAVTHVTAGFTDAEWDVRACGEWTATDLARHLLAVAEWYHGWLDRGEQGDGSPPFASDELAARNEEALARFVDVAGPVAVERFAARATAYGRRLRGSWDVAYGYPFGTVTAGLHAPVAATEWHLHAWDLATATGTDHRPGHPEALLAGVVECFGVARGGVEGRMLRRFGPATVRLGDPWRALLRRSGRRPVKRARSRT